mgnify:CR=1 FL=1
MKLIDSIPSFRPYANRYMDFSFVNEEREIN